MSYVGRIARSRVRLSGGHVLTDSSVGVLGVTMGLKPHT
jgi:hypothetical protein